MWGVCLDNQAMDVGLFQAVIRYEIDHLNNRDRSDNALKCAAGSVQAHKYHSSYPRFLSQARLIKSGGLVVS